ncbi:MAG: PilZ domain-containing protein [Acidobacteriia bacterium]|nr:PilZ domain-containing protein [Terriglobia bacterium]
MTSPDAISILLKLAGSHVVVIGEDVCAEEWACQAAELGAEVHLISPQPSDSVFPARPGRDKITFVRRRFEEGDLQACDWVIVSLQDYDTCKAIARVAREHRAGCAFTHFPELGSLVIPRTLDFDSFQVLFPDAPGDPQFNKTMSRAGRRFLPPEFPRVLQLLLAFDKKMREQIEDRTHHSRVLESLFDSSFPELARAGRWEDAEALAERVLQSYTQNQERRQRASPRVGANFEVQFRVENQSYRGTIFNLSRDGAFIATPEPHPKLTRITSLEFTLPSNEVIRNAEGFVVWENALDHPRTPIYPPGFALMFESLSRESLTAIEQYVLEQLK